MHKLVLLAAAAAGLAGTSFVATPSFAAPLLCNPFAAQDQCSLNFEWGGSSAQTITPTQTIYLHGHTDADDLHGLIQLQLGGNLEGNSSGAQTLTQTQTFTAHGDVYGSYPWSGGTPQVQFGLNGQYNADVKQTISQTQTMDAHDVGGSQQNQTALNIAVNAGGGSQTITQSQTIAPAN